jgi:hypothetical protein
MKVFKTAMLSAALVSTLAVAAYAEDLAATTPTTPPQIATNPGLSYSSGRMPGPKVGPSNFIPSPYSATNSTGNAGYYSGKMPGPKIN